MTGSKNSGIPAGRTAVLFGSLLLVLVSVFVSRGALSIGTVLFVCAALLHKNGVRQLRAFAATPYCWTFSLLFFIPFVSGLWSADLAKWGDVVRIKLPLLFFPLAFAGAWWLSPRQERILSAVFLLLVAGGCVWSLVGYAQNPAQAHEGYLRAKTLRTPLEDDHVRFSWLVSVAVIFCAWLLPTAKEKRQRVLLVLLLVFLVVYLHVLSARTGLLSVYLFAGLYALWQLRRLKSRKTPVLLLVALVALPVLAYLTLPTFRARLRYNLYDLSFVQKAAYLPGSSDGARTLSLKAGWQVLRQNPWGAGAGDVMREADRWYAAHVPEVRPADKFYPSSEWLLYGAFAGWLGVVLFTGVMAVPFLLRGLAQPVFWVGFHATAALSFAFDMGLEVQYGVFLYGFVAFWWWKRQTVGEAGCR